MSTIYKFCYGAKRPCLPWKGRWLSVSETGGVCSSTERYKKTPQSARLGCQLQRCIKHLYAINGYSC